MAMWKRVLLDSYEDPLLSLFSSCPCRRHRIAVKASTMHINFRWAYPDVCSNFSFTDNMWGSLKSRFSGRKGEQPMCLNSFLLWHMSKGILSDGYSLPPWSKINFTPWQFLNCICQLLVKLWRQTTTNPDLSLFQGHQVTEEDAVSKLSCFVSIYKISAFIFQRTKWGKIRNPPGKLVMIS